jgi:hypothetical protein
VRFAGSHKLQACVSTGKSPFWRYGPLCKLEKQYFARRNSISLIEKHYTAASVRRNSESGILLVSFHSLVVDVKVDNSGQLAAIFQAEDVGERNDNGRLFVPARRCLTIEQRTDIQSRVAGMEICILYYYYYYYFSFYYFVS